MDLYQGDLRLHYTDSDGILETVSVTPNEGKEFSGLFIEQGLLFQLGIIPDYMFFIF